MNFKYHLEVKLPKLAWCAVVTRGLNEIHVYHGERVETSENNFVEGAWDGDFSDFSFHESIFLWDQAVNCWNTMLKDVCFALQVIRLKDYTVLNSVKL